MKNVNTKKKDDATELEKAIRTAHKIQQKFVSSQEGEDAHWGDQDPFAGRSHGRTE